MKPGKTVRGKQGRFDEATFRLLPEGVVTIEGRILTRSADEIEQCLRRFHDEALKQEMERLVVDVARLEWISESAVTALVGWVLSIQREPTEKRYRVVFRINSSVPWQQGTFWALLSVAPDVVGLESA
jgi:hypothetical protein